MLISNVLIRFDARGPFAHVMRTVNTEGGGTVTGGAHLSFGRPGGVADPVALGWQQRYLTDDLVDDVLYGGHRVIATVYVDAGTMFRAKDSGPLEMAAIGETEYVNGVAAGLSKKSVTKAFRNPNLNPSSKSIFDQIDYLLTHDGQSM